jgi:hypothetical protein
MNYYQEWKKAKSIMGSPLVGRKIEEVINDFAAWLKESDTPTHDITDIEREAAELYPYPDESYFEEKYGLAMVKERVDRERAAHISCAKQFLDKVRGLEAENERLKAFEQKANELLDDFRMAVMDEDWRKAIDELQGITTNPQ